MSDTGIVCVMILVTFSIQSYYFFLLSRDLTKILEQLQELRNQKTP